MALVGIITLLWMSLLLAVSYFVLLTAEKAPEKIKSFGTFVGAVLITVALVIAVSGIVMLVTGTNPMSCPMMGGMKGGMMREGKMPCPMMKGSMKGGMQAPAQPQDASPIKCQ